MAEADPSTRLLRDAHDFSLEVADDLSFDKQHPWHRNLVALYGTQIELCGALLIVDKNRAGIAVRCLFRNLLEAFVELKNLASDRQYGNNMEAAHLKEWNKWLKSARDGNPYLSSIGELPDLADQIASNQEKLATYNTQGFKPLNVFQRFEMAGMENEYRSIYSQMSSDVHGNIRALIDRHFELNQEQTDFEIVIYKDYRGEFDHLFWDATGLLLESGLSICAALESSRLIDVQKRILKYNEAHEKST